MASFSVNFPSKRDNFPLFFKFFPIVDLVIPVIHILARILPVHNTIGIIFSAVHMPAGRLIHKSTFPHPAFFLIHFFHRTDKLAMKLCIEKTKKLLYDKVV